MSLEDMPAAPWNFSGKISGTSKMCGSSTGSSEPYLLRVRVGVRVRVRVGIRFQVRAWPGVTRVRVR